MQTTPDAVLIGRILREAIGWPCKCSMGATTCARSRFVLGLVRDPATAEDVISEVFFDVWQARPGGSKAARRSQPGSSASPGSRRSSSALRRRPEGEFDEDAAAAVADDADDPAVSLQKKDKAEVLRRCLAALSADHPGDRRSGLLS